MSPADLFVIHMFQTAQTFLPKTGTTLLLHIIDITTLSIKPSITRGFIP